MTAKNIALDMRLPGYFSYTEILEIELSKALAGEVTPQQALDTVAAGMEQADRRVRPRQAARGLPRVDGPAGKIMTSRYPARRSAGGIVPVEK